MTAQCRDIGVDGWEELMTEVVWFVLALVAYIGLGLWMARFLSTKWHPHE